MIFDKLNTNKGVELVIFRHKTNDKQTLGRFVIFDENDNCIFSGATLELPDRNNLKYVSRIPAGFYNGKKVKHHRFGKSLKIDSIKGRNGIYLHVGNYYHDIEGCILVGKGFKYINSDNKKDVYLSLNTMADIYQALQTSFNILIFNNF